MLGFPDQENYGFPTYCSIPFQDKKKTFTVHAKLIRFLPILKVSSVLYRLRRNVAALLITFLLCANIHYKTEGKHALCTVTGKNIFLCNF